MSPLEILLLGSPRILWHGKPAKQLGPRGRALLYRLAAQEGAVPRQHIAFLFWPHRSEAAVRRYIGRLSASACRALPKEILLMHDDGALELNLSLATSDAIRFQRIVADFHQDQNPEHLSTLVGLYRGPFLSGFTLANSKEFEDWVRVARTLWESDYLAVLHQLIAHAIQVSDHRLAIDCAQRYLDVDPLHEDMHRCLIELYGCMGNMEAAMRQYTVCADRLRRQYGRRPQATTTSAIESLMRGTVPEISIAEPPKYHRNFSDLRQRRRQWQEGHRPHRQKLVHS